MSVGENKYVALTTFTKDGRRKNCPVWIVDLGEGQVGFTTESTSWKAKRIMNTPAVELIASNSRGEPLEVMTWFKEPLELRTEMNIAVLKQKSRKNTEFNLC